LISLKEFFHFARDNNRNISRKKPSPEVWNAFNSKEINSSQSLWTASNWSMISLAESERRALVNQYTLALCTTNVHSKKTSRITKSRQRSIKFIISPDVGPNKSRTLHYQPSYVIRKAGISDVLLSGVY
jgi:hypothetical protein